MIRFAALVAAALLLSSPPALTWGGLGHEAVCELAFRELDDTARRRVIGPAAGQRLRAGQGSRPANQIELGALRT